MQSNYIADVRCSPLPAVGLIFGIVASTGVLDWNRTFFDTLSRIVRCDIVTLIQNLLADGSVEQRRWSHNRVTFGDQSIRLRYWVGGY